MLSVCGDCFELTGPANTAVAFFDFGANTTTTYQLQLTWDAAYLGPLNLDLVPPVTYAILWYVRQCILAYLAAFVHDSNLYNVAAVPQFINLHKIVFVLMTAA